jgi:hypothetical protein
VESRDDLLQPSLTEDRTDATAIYSPTAGYVSSFLGGPVAALAFAAVNSRRLGRLRADSPLLIAGLALFAAAIWWLETGPWHAAISDRHLSTGVRGAGLIYFGAIYFLHRRHYRAMSMLGIDSPNGWIVGLACLLLGWASTLAFSMWLER